MGLAGAAFAESCTAGSWQVLVGTSHACYADAGGAFCSSGARPAVSVSRTQCRGRLRELPSQGSVLLMGFCMRLGLEIDKERDAITTFRTRGGLPLGRCFARQRALPVPRAEELQVVLRVRVCHACAGAGTARRQPCSSQSLAPACLARQGFAALMVASRGEADIQP